MMTDDFLVARLREALDELTASPTGSEPLVVPHLDTVIVPLTDLRPTSHRRLATAVVLGIAAAAVVAVVLNRAPLDTGESVGSSPSTTLVVSAAEKSEGGIPRFSIDLPVASVARGPELQKSGTQVGWHRQVFTGSDLSDDRVVVINSYSAGLPLGPDTLALFTDSALDVPDTGVREYRASRLVGGTGPVIAEFISADTGGTATWMEARGLADDELSRLVSGGVVQRDDSTFALLDTSLGLIDVGPSAYGKGELWWSRFADYTLADGSRINVSVSTGTASDRFNDALAFDTDLIEIGDRRAYTWVSAMRDDKGRSVDQWGNAARIDLHVIQWHDDTYNVNVQLRGNIDQVQLVAAAAAIRLTASP